MHTQKPFINRCDLSTIYDLLTTYHTEKDTTYYRRAYERASAIEESNYNYFTVRQLKEFGFVSSNYLIDIIDVCIKAKKTLKDIIYILEWIGWEIIGKAQGE